MGDFDGSTNLRSINNLSLCS